MNIATIAYLAGAMDSDGYFSIKRSTYHLRVRKDAVNAIYSEQMGLKQVTPHVPELLKETFGGHMSQQRPSTANGKPLFGWMGTDLIAANAIRSLLPYLRIKREQAECIVELGYWRRHPDAHRTAWWWAREHPDWQRMPMLTSSEVATRLGYGNSSLVSQALRNRSVLALPRILDSHREHPRFPAPLIDVLATRNRRKNVTPPELMLKYETLWERVRRLNAIGTGLHPITERSGVYAPAG